MCTHYVTSMRLYAVCVHATRSCVHGICHNVPTSLRLAAHMFPASACQEALLRASKHRGAEDACGRMLHTRCSPISTFLPTGQVSRLTIWSCRESSLQTSRRMIRMWPSTSHRTSSTCILGTSCDLPHAFSSVLLASPSMARPIHRSRPSSASTCVSL